MREMKDSGIEWIGEIPKDWHLTKMKYIVNCFDGRRRPVDASLRVSGDYPYWGAGSIQDYVDDYIFDEDLILLGEDGAPFFDPYRPVSFLVSGKVWVNNHIHVLKEKDGWDRRYVMYSLNSVDYKEYINGTILNKLTQGNMNNIVLCFPSTSEQQAIADFLDRKCSEIDSLVSDIEEQIDTLEQYKKSVITETVTKGLNPDAEMKDSGVEWIDKISSSWDQSRIGFLAWLRARLGWKGLKADEYVDEGYPFLSAFNIQNSKIVWDNLNYINDDRYEESPEIKLQVGDIILVKDGAGIGKCARVDSLPCGESTTNGSLAVFTCKDDLDYKYLYYYFLSGVFQNYISRIMNGMGVPHLSQEELRKIIIPKPPIYEQHEISAFLDQKCSEIDRIISDKQSQLNTLAEYKKSLIYEYVTGKKEVPSA